MNRKDESLKIAQTEHDAAFRIVGSLNDVKARKTAPMINALEENIGNWNVKLEF